MIKLNKNRIKNQYLRNNNINLNDILIDKGKIKQFIKNSNLVNFPGQFRLFKNKESGILYLIVTTINFDIAIIALSKKQALNEQLKEIFPEFEFFNKNSAGGFNLFPGMKTTIYGFSNSETNEIILGSSASILEF